MEPKPLGYKNTSTSSAYAKSPQELREIIYNYIPEKSIVNDLKNSIKYLESKDHTPFTHNFSGRLLHPNTMFNYNFANDFTIYLYGGSFGMGCYHQISYNIQDFKYIYSVGESSVSPIFCSESWDDLHKYVSSYCENLGRSS